MPEGILPKLFHKLTKQPDPQPMPQPAQPAPKKDRKGGLLSAAAGAMKIPGFKHGGTVPKTGIYKLHKGEEVIPVGANGNSTSANSSVAYQERPGRRQGSTRDSSNRTRRRR